VHRAAVRRLPMQEQNHSPMIRVGRLRNSIGLIC
jgi:hypothetical protein